MISKISKFFETFMFEFFDNRTRKEELRVLSKSNMLKEMSPPYIVNFSIYFIAFGFAVLVMWASFTTVKEVVRAEGRIVPVGEIKKIQHLDGGLIKEILVRDGDYVKEGQTLIVLQNNSAKADYERFKNNELAIMMDIERVTAFVDKRQANFRNISSESENIIGEQEKLLDAMRKRFHDEKRILGNQLEQKLNFLEILRGKQIHALKSYKVSKEYYNHLRKLYKKRLVSKSEFLSAKRDKVNHWGRYSDLKTEIIQAQNSVDEFNSRLSSLELSTYEDSLKQLDMLKRDNKENLKNLKKLTAQLDRLNIKSPVSGFVKGSEANTLGAVVVPGRTILEVVPNDSPLEVQLKVPPKDIGQVEPGSIGLVKVSAFDYSRFGSIDSTVSAVSASSFDDDKFGVYYKVKMRMDKTYVGHNPFQNTVQPGMTVEGNIFVGEKSILSYLLKPIHNSLSTAFTEK